MNATTDTARDFHAGPMTARSVTRPTRELHTGTDGRGNTSWLVVTVNEARTPAAPGARGRGRCRERQPVRRRRPVPPDP